MNTFVKMQPARMQGSADLLRHNALAAFKQLCGAVITHLAGALSADTAVGQEERNARAAEYDSRVLRQAVHANSSREADWLLTAAILTDAAKRRYCLERALTINPGSEPARRALAQLSTSY